MKLGIISGSHRPDSQSAKVGRYIKHTLLEQTLCDDVWFLDLGGNPLPLWEEGVWDPEDARWQGILDPLRTELHSCDGLIVIAPEWHGMVPAGLKNFLLLWTSGGELAHKPALIVTVSGSIGGSYPVAELRMSGYKNNRLCFIPEHLIVRNVNGVFNADDKDNDQDPHTYHRDRLIYCLELLREYALAMRQVRASGKGALDVYPSGM
ncbi:MAG: NAD(P)H-dependent oxidoreductase [Halieaceae bacterium]|jgi:NAD(P)H-dependent FMN reductase|uniref:NADPH-dependent FMN reductase n=1 Tax=Haliea alexandrii TaxID=2448162 RepID=UPI000F0AFCAD|nr:NAD(P)H-dependent oxidoreductase [Haliea alexandrii]MCR9185360.1 NAD(P)H-dependent oxidoreductase [Halieaceae bacterium]